MVMDTARISTWTRTAALLCAAGASGALSVLSGCGDESCEQDYVSSDTITTSQNPYQISYLSSNLQIGGIRWQNVTTGASGVATITQVYECVPLILLPPICGDWSRVTMDIALIPGANTVHTYEQDGGCEWRSDYQITLN